MNTHKVVIKKVFLVAMKMYIFPKFCKMTAKTAFFETVRIFMPLDGKKVFENLKHICFVTSIVLKNPYIEVFVISLECEKIELLNFCWSLF